MKKLKLLKFIFLLIIFFVMFSSNASAKKLFPIPPIRVAVLPIINKTDEQPFFLDLVNKRFNNFLKNSNIELVPEKEVMEYLKRSGYDPEKKEFPSKDTLKYLAIMTNADDVIGLSLESVIREAPALLDVTYKLSAQVSVKTIEYERYKDDILTYDFREKGESSNAPYKGVSMEKAIINATDKVMDEALKSYVFSGFSNL
ncbi:hypothetical protein TDSAC_0069 [Thermodesulfobium acidiphilum]|uniref:Lipoprotein n=1 Tax=Thermodesulfobium acidiphilum TaxID=1794699 RepID=A0A2R4VY37_THEAF|nr:hypothetical protein [Thermodesulfobium acidiphilum]AWB09459.1 hypothetical protein TDSAC_0069 [Thermodesulfobium acidiphilum]